MADSNGIIGRVTPGGDLTPSKPGDMNSVGRATTAPALSPQPQIDQYGRVSGASTQLDSQTAAALQRYQTILAKPKLPYEDFISNPAYVKPGEITPTRQVSYADPYGRTGQGLADDSNKVLRGPQVTYSSPTPTPTGSGIQTDPTKIPDKAPGELNSPKPDGVVPGPDTLAGALTLGSVASTIYGAFFNSFDNITNSGITSFITNGIDSLGAQTGFFVDPQSITSPYFDVAGGQTTLSNALGYGTAGGAVAQMLGLGYQGGSGLENFFVNTGASLAGGAVGGAAGAALLGEALGSWAGPLGAIAGGFLFDTIAGWLGPGPTDGLSGGMYDLTQGSTIRNWTYDGSKHVPEHDVFRDKLSGASLAITSGITNSLGGELGLTQMRVDVGRRTGVRVMVGDNLGYGDDQKGRQFDTGKAAVEYVGKETLRTQKNLDADTTAVQKNIDWGSTSFDQAYYDMNFAHTFQNTALSFFNGNFNIDMDRDKAMQTIDAWEEKAKTLFSDAEHKDYATRAATTARATINKKFGK